MTSSIIKYITYSPQWSTNFILIHVSVSMLWNFSKFSFFCLRTTHSDCDSIFLVKQIRPNKVAFQYSISVVDKYTSHQCSTRSINHKALFLLFGIRYLVLRRGLFWISNKVNSMWIVLDRKDVSFEPYISSVV